jgi:ribosomal protein L17
MAGGLQKYRHLSRSSSHRQALLRNLVTSLFKNETISTTWPKAQEAQRLAEKLITLGKKNTDASKRKALSIFYVCPPLLVPLLLFFATSLLLTELAHRNPTLLFPNSSALFVNASQTVLVVTPVYFVLSPSKKTKHPLPFWNSSTAPRTCDSP